MYKFYFEFKDNSNISFENVEKVIFDDYEIEAENFINNKFPNPASVRTITLIMADGQAVVLAKEIKLYFARKQA